MAGVRTPSWWVAQIGRREHYAIAAALVKANRPLRLFTDYWLPEVGSDRGHPLLDRKVVQSVGVRSALQEVTARLSGIQGWPKIERKNRWFGRTAAAALQRSGHPPDIVFSYSYSAAPIFEAARKMGASTVLGQIDPGPVEFELVRGIAEKWGMPVESEPSKAYWDNWRRECDLADVILVNSAWSRQGLLEGGVAESKLQVIPLAVEAGTTVNATSIDQHRRYTTETPLRVLFLGQLVLRKGIMEMLSAAEQLSDLPIEWVLVGDGPPEILSRIRASHARISLAGQVDAVAVRQHYQKADLFILPTHSDGFAITQLEALAAGLPMLVSANCGRVVEDGQTGLLLEEVSPEAIIAAIKYLLDDPGRLNQYRRNIAQSRFAFGIDQLSENLISLEHSLHKDPDTLPP